MMQVVTPATKHDGYGRQIEMFVKAHTQCIVTYE
jgi:hypothetical protein